MFQTIFTPETVTDVVFDGFRPLIRMSVKTSHTCNSNELLTMDVVYMIFIDSHNCEILFLFSLLSLNCCFKFNDGGGGFETKARLLDRL